jgi:hypothetical protein
MKDSAILRRLKRLGLIFMGNARNMLWVMFPYLLAAFFGSTIGAGLAEERIHNDCKFTNGFRINTTGYICEIGK